MVRVAGWMDRAACLGVDPEVFFPDRGDLHGLGEALAVCAGCPVRHECLEFALSENLTHGVYGGMPQTLRRTERTRRGLAAYRHRYGLRLHGTEAAYRRHLRHGERPCPPCTEANHQASIIKWARRK